MLVFYILSVQFLIGFGVIERFEVISKVAQKLSLSVLMGFFFSTLVVYLLEVLHIKLTALSVFSTLTFLALCLNYNLRRLVRSIAENFAQIHSPIQYYELIFFGAIGYLLFFSVWRTYAMPVTPYDSIVGIDLVAKQAIKEGHIVSSLFFRADFRPFLSTQPYYAPFTMLMQVIYRLTGLPFGQVWLGILTISFVVFAYSKICETVHPILAGFFILLLFSAPELYAYTFLLQTDFANAVFFSIGMIFTIDFLKSSNKQYLVLGALFMGAACWSRTETIVLVLAIAPVLIFGSKNQSKTQSLQNGLAYLAFSGLFTFLWNFIFFKFYFPVVPRMDNQIIWQGLYEPGTSTSILNGMNFFLFNSDYWGYFTYFFLALFVVNLILYRRLEDLWLIGWLILFYACFFIMLHHFKLMNIEYTFRRAIMKFLLLMCLILGRFPILLRQSSSLAKIRHK